MKEKKEPKWKAEWERVVGNNKYFAIKKWEMFQEDLTTDWIKDYVNKEFDDPEYAKLLFFQRQVIDGLRRLRGRLRRNVPTDVTLILCALHTPLTDRPHVPHAILTLISRGFLIPCNVDDSSKKRREEKRIINKTGHPGQVSPEEEKQVSPVSPEKAQRESQIALRLAQKIYPNVGRHQIGPFAQKLVPLVHQHGEEKLQNLSNGCCTVEDLLEKLNSVPAAVPSPTVRKYNDIRDFNEDVGDISGEKLNRACRHLFTSNEWFRKNASPGYIKRNAQKVIDDCPPNVLVPKYERQADPSCRNCKGEGWTVYEDGDGDQSAVDCPCVKQVEVA